MKITDILSPEMVLPELKGNTKADVLRELAGYLSSKHREIDPAALFAVLAERERLGSTAIGDGIAIPHGKLPGVNSIIGVFGRHTRGVDFDSLDGGSTHPFFFLVPPGDSACLLLKALSRASRLLRGPAFRGRLANTPEAGAI